MTACPHLISAALALALGLAACQGCRSSGIPTGSPRSAESAVGPPTVRLYLITDLAGALEPCGCTKDQLGGLDHLGAWVRRERSLAPVSLVAAAGPLFFMDDKLDGERADQDHIKAETIARVLHGLDFAALAPGANDWADGKAGLTKLARTAGATVILGQGEEAAPFFGHVVRDVGKVTIGFVGFGQVPSGGGAPNVEQAVERGVEAAKKEGANVLVALTAVGRGEAKRIADAVPDLTAVVVGAAKARGDGNTSAPEGEQVGSVVIVQAANHLQNVAVLDLYVREPLSPGRIVKFADATGLELKPPPARGSFFRYALKEMRESLGKDPSIESDMLAYYKAVNDRNRATFADRLPPPHGPDEAAYIGVEACTRCHAPARAVWNATAHARAYTTLSSQFKEFNLECVGCHVTGYEHPGGSSVTHVDKLRNVQCEVCHGPGSKHALSPSDPKTIIASPQPGACLECHRPPHVEGFDPDVKMREILGPGHGMASN